MPTAVRMLRVSKGMEMGEVAQWLKGPGDNVHEGEPLLEIESEKSVVEVAAPASGVLLEGIVPEGERASVGAVVGWIGQPGEQPPESAPIVESDPVDDSAEPEQQTDKPQAGSEVRAAPAVRRLAAKHGISLAAVEGTGPGGRITKADVEAASATAGVTTERERRVPLRGIRRAMAERLVRTTPAAVTTVMDVDMEAVRALRQRLSVTYTSPVVLAAACALCDHEMLNASLDGDEIVLHDRVDVGVAVDTPRGLVVVTITGADKKSLTDVDAELRDLTAETREGRLRPEAAGEPTFTVTNSGVLGSLMFTPIIAPPQSATLGMGKVYETPVVRDGQIVAGHVMHLCLSYDHRIITGAEAVRFLAAIKAALEDPVGLEGLECTT